MSTRGRARGRTAAEEPQENFVDSTTETVNGNGDKPEETVELAVKEKKTSTKRKATTKQETPVENNKAVEVPAKRGRGKPKEVPIEPPVAATKPKRGEVKKVAEPKPVEIIAENEEPPAPKRGRGARTKAALKENPEPVKEPEPIEEPVTKSKRVPAKKAGKVSTAELNGGTSTKPEEPPAGPLGMGRGAGKENPEPVKEPVTKSKRVPAKKAGKVATAELNGGTATKSEEPAAGPSRKGRAAKTTAEVIDATVVKKPVKTAAARKIVSGGRGRKRASEEEPQLKAITEEIKSDEEDDELITAVKKKKATTKKPAVENEPKINATDTNYNQVNFNVDKEFNLKISSWNVAGLRAWIKKGGVDYVNHEKPDILCLQEIKCVPEQIPDEARLAGYHPYWLCKPGGHAGVAIYSKKMPINVEYGLGDNEQDEDGRIMTAEYEKFYLICVYVPNSGRKLVTLPKRLRWNELFNEFVEKLNRKKPVIICGDMNVAHTEIDLTNPKTNKKNAGFTQEERDGMSTLLSLGYVDSFRHFYPKQEKAYTFWSYFMNSRKKNVGWRLDYFIVSERFVTKCVDNVIRSAILGSDHCPITLLIDV